MPTLGSKSTTADPNGRSVWGGGLRPLACGFCVCQRSPRRAGHSSRGVLPSVIEEPHRRGLGLLGLSSRDKIMTSVCSMSRCRGPGQRSRFSDSLRAARSGNWIPVRGEIFRTRPDRPWGPLSLLHIGYRVFSEGKAAGAWRWLPTLI